MDLREALTAAAAAALLLPAAAAAQVDRFAVVIGNDAGQPEDAALRYAETDAVRVASVLEEVGGVRPENLTLLRGQDAATVRRTLIAVNDRIRGAGPETVLIVYYSGHADAESLHLGTTRLDLGEVEQLVRGSAARFRLLVLDACRSGALTRVKGGTPIPPFDIRLGERVAGEGAVFLTSSSASEDSQESDDIKGSFFTHALVSGLLGAADENGDGRVTLDEAYRYAYEATLRASSRTLAGMQHPTFRYEVRGQGGVVLATVDAKTPGRGFIEFPEGRTWLLFQGSADGGVVGEIGARDKARRLSVRAAQYFVRGRGPDVLLEGSVSAPAGETVEIDEKKLDRIAYARLVRKGGGPLSVASLEVDGRVRSSLASDAGACPGVAIGMAVALRSFTITPRFAWCRSGFSGPGIHASVDQYDMELSAAHVWDVGLASIQFGLTIGGSLLTQAFSTQGAAPRRTTGALQLAPTIGIAREVGQRTYVYMLGSASTYLMRTEDPATAQSSFGPSFAIRTAIGAGFRL
ncbi:MAG TPA: caspase family protein [Myxococcales bacterium]|nr:caspase family protein [Myxococcales bacterium]